MPPSSSRPAWVARCELAALFRVLDQLGMSDLIYTHLSARVPGSSSRYLLAPAGKTFDEIVASDLLEAELSDRALAGVEDVALSIHGSIYRARPDIGCVIHTHSVAGVAVSTMADGLLPISQHALMVMGELAYHEYQGPATTDEMLGLARATRSKYCVILRNHGLLAMGGTIANAFGRIYFLERACQVQLATRGAPGGYHPIDEAAQAETIREYMAISADPRWGEQEWAAMLRMLERRGSDHAR